MKPEKLLETLEKYEQAAYGDEFLGGAAWLERIGEGFKLYVQHCVENKSRVTISGFVRYIDKMAEELELVNVK